MPMYRIGDKGLEEESEHNPFKSLRSPSPPSTPEPEDLLALPPYVYICIHLSKYTSK